MRVEPGRSKPGPLLRHSATYVCLLGLVLWSPLPFGSVEPWAIGIIRIGAFALVALWVFESALQGRFTLPRTPVPYFVFALAALAASQWLSGSSADPFLSLRASITLSAFGLLLVLATVTLDSRFRLWRASIALFSFGFILSVVALLVSLSGSTRLLWLRESPTETFFGPYVNKNHFAGLMEMLIPLGLGPVVAGGVARERIPLVIFGAVIMGMGTVLCRSRAGLMCVAAELILISLIAYSMRSRGAQKLRGARLALLTLVVVACVTIGVLWIGIDPVSQAFGTLPGELVATGDLSRQQIWRSTIALGSAHMLTGAGLGAYGVAIPGFWFATEHAALLFAHNDYLQVFSDAGAIGVVLAILYLVFLGRAFLRGLKRTDPVLRGVSLGAGVGCIGLLLHSVVDFNLQIPANALVFLYLSALVLRSETTPEVFGEVVT